MDFKTRLQGMQDSAAKQMTDYVPGGNFATIPDGEYNCRVKVTLDETKKAPPRLTMVWCFVVDEGDFIGKQVWNRTIIEDNKVGLHIARDIVEQLGYEWPEENLALLVDVVEDITSRGPKVRVNFKTKTDGEYTNTNVRVKEVFDFPKDLPVNEVVPDSEPVVEEKDNETLGKVLDFCASQGIDGVDSSMSVQDIVQGLVEAKLTFKSDTLTDEETALLIEIGAEALIDPVSAKPIIAKKSASRKK